MEIRKCIPLPPSVACIFLEMTNKDPHEMGPILARTIFDIENDVNHKCHGVISSVEGKELIDEILTWLFYAERYASFSLDCRVAFPGSRVDMASKELHKAKLSHENIQGNMETQNRTIAANMDNRGLNNFLESIERHTAAIQEMAESRKDQDAEKAALINDKGFNKLPNDIQSFLLALASNDLENPAESISQTGLDMLKLSQKNSIVALSRLLKKQGKCAVNLSIAQSNEITSINWFAQNNPFVGLSTCRIPPISKLHSSESAMEKTQKLELLQKLEIEKQEVLQTLTDKSLYKPGSMDDVIRNIETIQGTMEIYLGSQCAIVQRIVDFIQSIKQYRLNLEFKAAADENLLTKIQYLFDSRLNTWMEDVYENADRLANVSHSLIDFTTIIQNIFEGSFCVSLPQSLLPATTSRTKRLTPDGEESQKQKDDSEPKEKHRKGAINPSPNPDWKLKDGEKWEHFNRDPDNLRPASVCYLYHVLGHCPQGQQCRRAKSHCKLTNESIIRQTKEFIENCRKNAKP
jgi:hypothetical protein